jgi:hypothetical protein
MSKHGRTAHERSPRDFYPTPVAAVVPLLKELHGARPLRFVEPCAGDGALVRALEAAGHVCVHARDLAPRGPGIATGDGAALTKDQMALWGADAIVTNPPFAAASLDPLLACWTTLGVPLWLLLDHDWSANQAAAPYAARISRIVQLGRVRWIAGSKGRGTANFDWLRFEPVPLERPFIVGQRPRKALAPVVAQLAGMLDS